MQDRYHHNSIFRKYLPSIVYGGSDGAVSYFTLMAGAFGAGLPLKTIIVIGISNVVADAFSMASADYLSEDSKGNLTKKEEFSSSFLTFISFVILGLFPIIPTLLAYLKDENSGVITFDVFILSTLLTVTAFSFIGYLRGYILKRNKIKSVLQSVFICSISAAVAYFVGEYVANILL